MAELDSRRARVLYAAAKSIQRKVRTYIARKRFLAMREAAIRIQAYWRGIEHKESGHMFVSNKSAYLEVHNKLSIQPRLSWSSAI
jgi:myosin heavy subunit